MSQHSSGSQRQAVTEDERLLTQLPRERRAFTKTDSWRVLRIMGEFVEGFDTLSDVYNAVTIFGSARTPPDDPYYEKAVETCRLLAEDGFPILTGGGVREGDDGVAAGARRRRREDRQHGPRPASHDRHRARGGLRHPAGAGAPYPGAAGARPRRVTP